MGNSAFTRPKFESLLVRERDDLGKGVLVSTATSKSSLVRTPEPRLDLGHEINIRLVNQDVASTITEPVIIGDARAFRDTKDIPTPVHVRTISLLTDQQTDLIGRQLDLVTHALVITNTLRRARKWGIQVNHETTLDTSDIVETIMIKIGLSDRRITHLKFASFKHSSPNKCNKTTPTSRSRSATLTHDTLLRVSTRTVIATTVGRHV
nr:MAG: hypothetical protein [Crogonang virus 146]